MKKVMLMLCCFIVGCNSSIVKAPKQFYQANGDYGQTAISGQYTSIGGINGRLSVLIDDEEVIEEKLSLEDRFTFVAEYKKRVIKVVCSKQYQQASYSSSLSCFVFMDSERAANLKF